MRVLGFLLEKEFKLFFRNPILILVVLLFTPMVLLLFPLAINFDIKHVRLSVVDQDRDTYSQRLVSKLEGTPSLDIMGYYGSYDEAMNDIEIHKSLMVLVIPDGFSHALQQGASATVQVLTNAVDGTQAGIATGYIHDVLGRFSEEVFQEETGYSLSEQIPIEIRPIYEYNRTLDYRHFMLPAFVVVLLTMFSGIFTAMSIVSEKEIGTQQQINVTPVKRSTYILAKVIPFWLVGLVALLLSAIIIDGVYGLPLRGSFTLYILSGFTFIVSMTLLGVILSNVSQTLQQAMFLTLFFILIFFLISGLFTPVNAMPWWAQAIAYSNPLTYFLKIIRMLYLKGAGFSAIAPHLLVLSLFALLFGVVAVLTHKKRS